MPRPTNTAERRAQIARGLLGVMAKRGYDGASINDIARRARVAPGIVHYHFSSKLEILVEAVRALTAGHADRVERALAEPAGAWQDLVTLIELHLDLKHADPSQLACWIQIAGEALRHAAVRAELEAALAGLADRFAAVIARGVAAGELACEAPAAAAAALTATIQGYFLVAATASAVIPRGSAATTAVVMAEALVAPRRRATRARTGAR